MLAWALLCGLPPAASAQRPPEPSRPRLARSADPNDWESYYDHAAGRLRSLPSEADAAFEWAGRLGPHRAEPLYGRWVAFWLRNLNAFEDYLDGSSLIPGAAQADSLRARALWRNPLLPPTLEVLIYDQLPGAQWGYSPLTRGLLFCADGEFAEAARLWDRVIRENPRKWAWLRFERASVLAQLHAWDEALAELDSLDAELERRSNERLTPTYASREALHYAIGMLHLARGDRAAARSALGRALTENLGYAPAHATLGDLALAVGNPITAVPELAQAVELAPEDVYFRFRLGVALVAAGRADSGASVLAEVNRREPRFPDPYLELGKAWEIAGVSANALAAYREYVTRAPRREAAKIQWARDRIVALDPAR